MELGGCDDQVHGWGQVVGVCREDGEKFEYLPVYTIPEEDKTVFYLLFYSETRFIHGHFQSIRPIKPKDDSDITKVGLDLRNR